MRKTLLFALASLLMASCAEKQELRHPEWAYDATIYELNTRQATPEGTFASPAKVHSAVITPSSIIAPSTLNSVHARTSSISWALRTNKALRSSSTG